MAVSTQGQHPSFPGYKKSEQNEESPTYPIYGHLDCPWNLSAWKGLARYYANLKINFLSRFYLEDEMLFEIFDLRIKGRIGWLNILNFGIKI